MAPAPLGPGDRVGFIGAGRMGGPMVGRLVGAGVGVRLFARRPEVAQRWRGEGAQLYASAAELAGQVDVLIVCLYSDEQLQELLLGPGGVVAAMPPGSVLVSHVTSAPELVDAVAAALAKRSASLVDAPVSGTAEAIDRGELTVLLGGAAGALDRVEPVLAAYCSVRARTGGAGSATRMKLVNNLWFAVNVQVTALAVDLADKLGLTEEAVLDCISRCSADSAALRYVQQFGSVANFGEEVGHYLRKDFGSVKDACGQVGVDLGLLEELVVNGPLHQLHP